MNMDGISFSAWHFAIAAPSRAGGSFFSQKEISTSTLSVLLGVSILTHSVFFLFFSYFPMSTFPADDEDGWTQLGFLQRSFPQKESSTSTLPASEREHSDAPTPFDPTATPDGDGQDSANVYSCSRTTRTPRSNSGRERSSQGNVQTTLWSFPTHLPIYTSLRMMKMDELDWELSFYVLSLPKKASSTSTLSALRSVSILTHPSLLVRLLRRMAMAGTLLNCGRTTRTSCSNSAGDRKRSIY